MSYRTFFRRDVVWLWYLAIASILTVAYLFVPPFKGYAGLINLIGLMSPMAIALGIRMHRPKAVLAWSLLLFGQLLYVAGDVYTYSYPALLGGAVGFPSAGDAIYLLVYPALFAGLLLLVRRRNPSGDRAAVIDSLILTVGFALLSWVFLVAPNIHLSGLSLLAKLVSVAYPLGDILLLAALIRLAVDGGRRTTSFYLLAASTVALLATDCAYNYALLARDLQPSADLRRRLDRVPRPVGCGCAASVDALARAADSGCAGAAVPHAPRRCSRSPV